MSRRPRWSRTVARFAVALGAGYLTLCALFFALQSHLIWIPGAPRGVRPEDEGLRHEELWLATEDGERLHAWLLHPEGDPRGALLVSHGNAGTIEDRLELARFFVDQKLAVLLYDYRGYGRSSGSPGEEGTYADARAAWRELVERRGFAPGRIVLYGESLGAAVALELAGRVESAGLILHEPFTSLGDAGRFHYPWLPDGLLARASYDNLGRIGAVRCPKLVIHSPADEILPFEQGLRLFEAASEPKEFLRTAGTHNDLGYLLRPEWRRQVREFVSRALEAGAGR